jgi:hypothetical protein
VTLRRQGPGSDRRSRNCETAPVSKLHRFRTDSRCCGAHAAPFRRDRRQRNPRNAGRKGSQNGGAVRWPSTRLRSLIRVGGAGRSRGFRFLLGRHFRSGAGVTGNEFSLDDSDLIGLPRGTPFDKNDAARPRPPLTRGSSTPPLTPRPDRLGRSVERLFVLSRAVAAGSLMTPT